MRLAVNGIEEYAGFYRGYATDDRSPVPLTILLATGVAVWLLFYLVSVVGPVPGAASAIAVHAHATAAIVESAAR